MNIQRIFIPVRYAAWMSGALGRTIRGSLTGSMPHDEVVAVLRRPRGFILQSAQLDHGQLVNIAMKILPEVEAALQSEYPIFHKEMGPVFAGTVQVFANDLVIPETPSA